MNEEEIGILIGRLNVAENNLYGGYCYNQIESVNDASHGLFDIVRKILYALEAQQAEINELKGRLGHNC